MDLFLIAGLVALSSVCSGTIPAEPTEHSIHHTDGTAAPYAESPLIAYLPSVIAFLEEEPLFLEWYTERELLFIFPSFLENYILHVTASDANVGSVADDGWVNLSRTITPSFNLSETMFLNLTLLDAFAHNDLMTLEDMDHPTSSRPTSKGNNKGAKKGPKGNMDNNGTMENGEEDLGNPKMEDKSSSGMGDEGTDMKTDMTLIKRLKTLVPANITPLASNFTLIGDRFGKMTLSFELYRTVDGQLELDPEMTAIAKDIDVLNIRIPT